MYGEKIGDPGDEATLAVASGSMMTMAVYTKFENVCKKTGYVQTSCLYTIKSLFQALDE